MNPTRSERQQPLAWRLRRASDRVSHDRQGLALGQAHVLRHNGLWVIACTRHEWRQDGGGAV